MANPIEKLLVVQEKDREIRGLQRELQDIPVRKGQEVARMKEHQDAVTKAEEGIRAVQARLRELELETRACEERIEKFRGQQVAIKTNREFKAIETEIQGVQAVIAGQEEKELGLMEELESARADLKLSQAALREEEASVKTDVAAFDARAAAVQSQLTALQGERAAAALDVDPAWLARYDHIMTRRDRALVPIEDGVCGGCHMQLPRYVVHDTKKHAEIVVCGFCGRMLY